MKQTPTLTLTGHAHGHGITAVSWSNDALLLASGSWDNTLRVWDAASGECKHVMRRESRTCCISWSRPSVFCPSVTIATGSSSGVVQLWPNTSLLWQFSRCLYGHTNAVTCVAWMIDPTRLASGSKDGAVRLWDVVTGNQVYVFSGHTFPIIALGSTSTDRWSSATVSLCSGGSLCVWGEYQQPHDEQIITQVEDCLKNTIVSAAAQRDSNNVTARVAIASRPSILHALPEKRKGRQNGRCFDTHGENSVTFRVSTWLVSCVDMSSDGKQVAIGRIDGSFVICDAVTGKCKKLIHCKMRIDCVAWSPDGTRVATASGNTIRVWTVCKWSDKRNKLFDPETRRIIFCLMCVRESLQSMPTTTNNDLPDLPMELWLEVFAMISVS